MQNNLSFPGNGANLMIDLLRGRKGSNNIYKVKTPLEYRESGSNTGRIVNVQSLLITGMVLEDVVSKIDCKQKISDFK